jgi:hypothetical protein
LEEIWVAMEMPFPELTEPSFCPKATRCLSFLIRSRWVCIAPRRVTAIQYCIFHKLHSIAPGWIIKFDQDRVLEPVSILTAARLGQLYWPVL